MVPTGRARGISVIDAKGLAKSQVIPAKITREIYPVLLAEFVIGLYIQVIEIEAVIFDGRVAGQFEKDIGIRTAATDRERSLVLYKGAFRIETGREIGRASCRERV